MNENDKREYYLTLRTILGATLVPTMTDDEIINRIEACSQALIKAMSTGDPIEDNDDERDIYNPFEEETEREKAIKEFIAKYGEANAKRLVQNNLKADMSYTASQLQGRLWVRSHLGYNDRHYLMEYAEEKGWIKREQRQGNQISTRYTLNI